MASKVTVHTFQQMKQKGEKIAMLTCYDYSMAKLLDELEVEGILVGDSLGMTLLGYDHTLPVTLAEMAHHTRSVHRARPKGLLIADMPYLSYELDPKEAARNAGTLVKEAGAEAVKLEGGLEVASAVKEILKIHIPVMGHLGLTPQSIHCLGGYRMQGRDEKTAEKILTDAKVLEGSGAFAVVLEGIPSELAREVTRKISIPTIGIGAGPYCDGQVLVLNDLLGLYHGSSPSFAKRYADLRGQAKKAIQSYIQEVKSGAFPSPKEVVG
ncbi:MAG: 3-methyl-2-oxobutanoate hydroxymethyltransferase [Elusimicrobia bacterium]|nr:3-methyl-2-oxobutanoate hydroxymethyltransferase [Elusimicrobiota bacterium]